MRSGKGKLMVVLVDGAAHRTQRVVAVGQHIRQGELFHAGGARRLDDADVGDVVRDERVKADAQVLLIAGRVRVQDLPSDRARTAAVRRALRLAVFQNGRVVPKLHE